jgi:hypothetical protein
MQADFSPDMSINKKNINAFRNFRSNFFSCLDTVYGRAIMLNEKGIGSKECILNYFNKRLSDHLSADTNSINYLFILTDGYSIDSKKEMTVTNKFPGLHVLVMEMSPQPMDNEYERLKCRWIKYFQKSGILYYNFMQHDALSKNKVFIDHFMNGRYDTSDTLQLYCGPKRHLTDNYKKSTQESDNKTAPEPKKKSIPKPQNTVSTYDYSSKSLLEKMNLLADSANRDDNLRQSILSEFASVNSEVNVYFKSGHFSGTSYTIGEYLDRLKILKLYRVVKITKQKKDKAGKITEINLIENLKD